jgi:uncharacterized membrane protein YgdD (TMEM256/DUF423 family)
MKETVGRFDSRWPTVTGAVLAGLAVALGAIGAHMLERPLQTWYGPTVAVERAATWETAVRYQMFHGIGLILVGLAIPAERRIIRPVAAGLMLVGVLVFSGLLYAWILTAWQPLVHIVPAGGVMMIAGWFVLALGIKSRL